MAKIIAVNGSPKKEKGNTSMILKPFLEGMEEAGAKTEVFYTHSMDIQPCTGEFICWNKTPGECYITDDMQELYPKLREADILVFATPVYIPLPAKFQIFVNRLVPLMNPVLERREGRTRARLREDVHLTKFVLVSTSGWWEKENMDTVVRIVSEMAEDSSVEFPTPLLRPHAYLMKKEGNLTKEGEEIREAAKKAGYDLITKGTIDEATAEKIRHPLISFDEYLGR
jgi:multimeric flavodoxin WrbA